MATLLSHGPLTDEERRLAESCVHLPVQLAGRLRSLQRMTDYDDARQYAGLLLVIAAKKYRSDFIHPETGLPVEFPAYAATCIKFGLRDIVSPACRRRYGAESLGAKESAGDDGDRDLDPEIEDAERASVELRDDLSKVMAVLTPDESRVVSLRFGLIDGETMTADEVAFTLGRSRAEVLRLEGDAIRKMRVAVGVAGEAERLMVAAR